MLVRKQMHIKMSPQSKKGNLEVIKNYLCIHGLETIISLFPIPKKLLFEVFGNCCQRSTRTQGTLPENYTTTVMLFKLLMKIVLIILGIGQ